MRRKKELTIAGHAVTIYEISVSRLFRMLRGEESILRLPATEAAEKVKELIPLAFEADIDVLLAADLFYDDLTEIFQAFKETNPAFFETARVLGLASVLENLVKTLLQGLSNRLLSSLKMDTEIIAGNGDMASSSI